MENTPAPLPPRLRDALRRLPVPPPKPGFAARALAGLRGRTRRIARVAGYALAASLCGAIGLGVWLDQPLSSASPEARVVALVPGQSGAVRLAFRSPRELAGVTIRLQLPRGVELQGHPGRQSLEWQADFQAGANVLELPLVVLDGEGGLLTATLDHGRSQKAFTIQVRAERPAALFPDSPATRSAVDGRFST